MTCHVCARPACIGECENDLGFYSIHQLRADVERLKEELQNRIDEISNLHEHLRQHGEPVGSVYRNSVTGEFELLDYKNTSQLKGTHADIYAAPIPSAPSQDAKDAAMQERKQLSNGDVAHGCGLCGGKDACSCRPTVSAKEESA